MSNDVLLSHCTKQAAFKGMKRDLINAIKDMDINGAIVTITTEKERDGYIACSTSIDAGDSGYGNYYGGVRFVNPESIINFILHCAGYTKIGSMGFGVVDISDDEVEITLVNESATKH